MQHNIIKYSCIYLWKLYIVTKLFQQQEMQRNKSFTFEMNWVAKQTVIALVQWVKGTL